MKAREGVEVCELPRLAEAARVLDRRRDPLGKLLEPAHVVVAEAHLGVPREDAEPADPAAADNERDPECPVHRSGGVRFRVEVGKLDRPRLALLRRPGEDADASLGLFVFIPVEPDRPEQALVAVAVRLQLDDGCVDLREPGGGLQRGADRVVEIDRRGDLAEEPAALRLLLGAADRAAQLLRKLVEPCLEALDGCGHLGLDVTRAPPAQPTQQLERQEDADDEPNSETDG